MPANKAKKKLKPKAKSKAKLKPKPKPKLKAKSKSRAKPKSKPKPKGKLKIVPAALVEAKVIPPLQWTVAPEFKGLRMDLYLTQQLKAQVISRSRVQRLMADNCVTVNGVVATDRVSLHVGDVVTMALPVVAEARLIPQDLKLNVLFEDADIIVVNKVAGMLTHPGAGHPDGTLVNALLYHCKGKLKPIQGQLRPGIVHRLDKDTTGCLVVAKSEKAFVELQRMIAAREVTRIYRALVWGDIAEESGTIEGALARDNKSRKRMAVVFAGGKEATTHFKVEARYGLATELELKLETGRTHQIRAHLLSIGHAVLCDPDYGRLPPQCPEALTEGLPLLLKRQALHAWKLSFAHPCSGKPMAVMAPLPSDYIAARALLRKVAPPR